MAMGGLAVCFEMDGGEEKGWVGGRLEGGFLKSQFKQRDLRHDAEPTGLQTSADVPAAVRHSVSLSPG